MRTIGAFVVLLSIAIAMGGLVLGTLEGTVAVCQVLEWLCG